MTDAGRAWLIKAMHPSDAANGMAGIPTRDARPTVPLNFMVTQNIPSPGGVAPWNANILLNPTPLYFGKVATNSGANYGTTTIFNTQLGVAGPAEFGATARSWNTNAVALWCNNVCKYRLCYASVTATLSASSTSNEGTVTCAQYPFTYRQDSYPLINVVTPSMNSSKNARYYPLAYRGSSVLQGIVGSTTWEAREGAYSILRLGEETLTWNTPKDVIYPMGIASVTQVTQTGIVAPSGMTDLSAAVAASANDVPFGPQGIWGKVSTSGSGATFSLLNTGDCTLPPCQEDFSHLVFSGLDANASLQLTFRVGFEAIVPPESVYAGQVTPALEPDSGAIDSYFRHSRFLQSAYPASYNIFGAIGGFIARNLPKIVSVGRAVLPHALNALESITQASTPSTVVTTQASLRPPPLPPRPVRSKTVKVKSVKKKKVGSKKSRSS